MRFDIHFRAGIRQQLEQLASEMRDWEALPRVSDEELEKVQDAVQGFSHTTRRNGLVYAGGDGSGDFPAVAYGDSFVYVTVAQATCYETHATSGLRERSPLTDPLVSFAWIPEDESRRVDAFDAAFEELAGHGIDEVIDRSDYRSLKGRESGRTQTVSVLRDGLIRPHAADAGNIAVQLRSTGELGAALRLLERADKPNYYLYDGTMSLPFVSRRNNSLFYEHLKRLCCVVALVDGVGFFTLSKSHGLPSVETLEDVAREKLGLNERVVAEHCYIRLPVPGHDDWELSLAHGRRLPPPGAVTYLFRFHKNTPVMRLDMDAAYWETRVLAGTEEETRVNERRIFEDLDYASHDQRCFGYPYPIKAGHDRASLTQAERLALRKQIIDAAVQAGMRRSLFRDVSMATGHE